MHLLIKKASVILNNFGRFIDLKLSSEKKNLRNTSPISELNVYKQKYFFVTVIIIIIGQVGLVNAMETAKRVIVFKGTITIKGTGIVAE